MKYAKITLFVGGFVLAACASWAQTAPFVASSAPVLTPASDNAEEQVFVIKARVDEVHLLFTATDRRGKFVNDLSQKDVSVLDDHKPPQSILNFRHETDLPLQVGLLIDVSGSVRSRFSFEQQSAIDFLQKTLRKGFDQAFVAGFNGRPQVTQDFTDDVKALSWGIQRLRAGGGTALYDAIYRSCRDKLAKTSSDRPQRRALIVLSDGDDNQSEVSREAAIEMAQRAEVIIFAISTDDSPSFQRGDNVLRQMAEATGGRAFFPLKDKDIVRSFASIEDELRSQYIISYKPAEFLADGRYRSIELATGKKDLQLRARKGYYAPRQ